MTTLLLVLRPLAVVVVIAVTAGGIGWLHCRTVPEDRDPDRDLIDF